MKAMKINRTGAVEPVDVTWSELVNSEVTWDAVTIERTHSVYFDDEGLFAADAVVATIGMYPSVPLPAIILGLDGENNIDVSFTTDEVAAMVTNVRAAR